MDLESLVKSKGKSLPIIAKILEFLTTNKILKWHQPDFDE